MTGTGTINVSVFDAARQPWAGPEVRLVLTDPFTVYTLLFDQGIRPLYTLKA
jgi:hypothetical protein